MKAIDYPQKLIPKMVYFMLTTNYYLSVCLLLSTPVLVMLGKDFVFDSNEGTLNPLLNNLRIILFYLALIEICMIIHCYLKRQWQTQITLGGFYIILTGLIEFYAQINQISLKQGYQLFFIYIGISHVIFGIYDQSKNAKTH